jgi:hypothetical protein
MEERRFDALTRTLGAAGSRRQLLKGVLGGALAGVFAFRQRPDGVKAASTCEGATSDPNAIRICERNAWTAFSNAMKICQGDESGGYKAGGVGALIGCTIQAELNLRDQLHACRTEPVCPTGLPCCGGACCSAETWCCPSYASGTRVDSCVDRQTDPQNCGGCGNHCDPGKICQGGQCVCPPEKTTCSGPWGSDICCNLDEECGVDALLLPICVPKCKKCEEYDATSKTCKPTQCGTCQVCDGDTGQCETAPSGTACGSGLVCCGETCQGADDPCNNQGDSGGCGVCEEYDENSGCVPKQDGTTCGSCGKCSGGACIPDLSQSCPTCQTCGAGGVCSTAADGTSCGSNEVCCGGTCTPGDSCPCPSGQHQCTSFLGSKICCDNADQCCVNQAEQPICGPYNGVCCTGDQYQCGTICCDSQEVCGINTMFPTGKCCPHGTILVDDGSCCDSAQYCDTGGSFVCCPSGQQCVYSGGKGSCG